MKKLALIPILLLSFSVLANAQQNLNSNASYIKSHFPNAYKNTLRQRALNKWKTDYEMVVYEINQQANDLVKLTQEFKSDYTNIAFRAIEKWSVKNYKSSNIRAFKKIKTFSLKNLIKLHCDWEMVKYEYDNQVKAKNAF